METKPTLVLIHGHGVDSSVWDDVVAQLAGEYSIIKPDFSRLSEHETIEAYAERLYSLLQGAQVNSCVVIGHSMGGYIALAFAEQHPEMILGLGLFHSTAFADDESKKEKRQSDVKALEEQGSKVFIEKVMPNMLGDSYKKSKQEATDVLIEKFSNLPAEALAAGVKAIAGRPDRTGVLKNASFPVLIIAGREDSVIPFEKSEALFDLPQNARPVVLETSGHLGMIEAPEEAVKIIRKFMSELG
ncbi:alpha/beta fold hydrolase [Tellurirhabdus bombi]|uniref:alpha/beta fold hydrolase n=1 Tax=Tellurirhabdus bombi TaxID=2907205 RepID=UPI001F29241C|nr:alpha/beta hydrolase [Tellurirhabdus bombi]